MLEIPLNFWPFVILVAFIWTHSNLEMDTIFEMQPKQHTSIFHDLDAMILQMLSKIALPFLAAAYSCTIDTIFRFFSHVCY